MKMTWISAALVPASVAGLMMLTACCHRQEAAPTPAAEEQAPAAEAPRAEKQYAPVELTLTSSGTRGEVDVVLEVTATANLSNGHARLVLPEGVKLLSPTSEVELGALTKGQQATLEARVSVPATGSYVVAGGFEVVMSRGVKLAKSVVLGLGEVTKEAAPKVIQLPEGGSVRVPQ